MLGLRLGSEAAGQLGILGQTFGDSIRVSHLSPEIRTATGLASVTLDRGLYVVTGAMITIAGIVAALPVLSLSHTLRLYAGLFVVILIAFLLLTLLGVRTVHPQPTQVSTEAAQPARLRRSSFRALQRRRSG